MFKSVESVDIDLNVCAGSVSCFLPFYHLLLDKRANVSRYAVLKIVLKSVDVDLNMLLHAFCRTIALD
jgi:hypothetical protein